MLLRFRATTLAAMPYHLRSLVGPAIVASLLTSLPVRSQSFVNGDLDGTVNDLSSLPGSWTNVPYDDPVCNATFPASASPDLISLTAPMPSNGIHGMPYSGSTYVGGVHGRSGADNHFREGIMQEVGGFVPGVQYRIAFHQSVDARYMCEDTSGSWGVYVDATLAGITEPTGSQVPMLSTALEWERREILFTATATTHTIKFLPTDDDTNDQAAIGDRNGALSMGIDAISVAPAPVSVDEMEGPLDGQVRYDAQQATLFLDHRHTNKPYRLLDMSGRVALSGNVASSGVPLRGLVDGAYLLHMPERNATWRFVKY